MNFFFCEACGKRVTDGDLELGLARDKKLKGVYCKACAANVNTIEFTPMTDAQARVLAATVAPATPAAVPSLPATPVTVQKVSNENRRASNVRLTPAARMTAVTSPAKAEPGKPNVVLICAVLGIAALICGLVLALGGDKTRVAGKDTKLPSAPEPAKSAWLAPSKPAEPVKLQAKQVERVDSAPPTGAKIEKPAQVLPIVPMPVQSAPINTPPEPLKEEPSSAPKTPSPVPSDSKTLYAFSLDESLNAPSSGDHEIAKDPPAGAKGTVARARNNEKYPMNAYFLVNAERFPRDSAVRKAGALFSIVDGAKLHFRFHSEPGHAMELNLYPSGQYHAYTKKIEKFTIGAWTEVEAPVREFMDAKGKNLEPGVPIKEIRVGAHGSAAGYTLLIDELKIIAP
jgi:hypothetical protein